MDAKGLGRIWASNPASPNVDPGIDKYNKGWVAEIPIFQMLNFINNRYDTNILSLAERGMFQWGNDITYENGALAWDEIDDYIYVSKVVAPDKSKAPSTNSAQWERSSIQITRAQYDAELAKWNAHIANTSNPHQLTCAILNTYTRQEIDAKIAVPTSTINSHISNYNNPHQVTAAQVGAVPITGGTYTGLVNHQNAATGLGTSNLNAKFNSDTVGTFLMKGTAKIGLDATSTAVFIDDGGVSSPLLSEADYIGIREVEEASFVPPVPDLLVLLRTSTAVFAGVGTSTFTGPAGRGYIAKNGAATTAGQNEPRYSVKGLQVSNALSEALSIPNAGNLNGFDTYTVVLDCVPTKSKVGWLAKLNSGGTIFQGFYQNTNGLYYDYSEGGIQKYMLLLANNLISGEPAKLAITYDGTTLIGYVQGNEVARVVAAVNNIDGTNITFGENPDAYYNSLRTWATALTSRQISGT